MKVAIIGYGYVGKAYHKIFKEAVLYDPYNSDSGFGSATKEQVNECDIALIAVPTPTSDDGSSCDTSIVEEVFSWLDVSIALIKSTIKPGTTEMLQEKFPDIGIAFSPEFVGEGGYFVPFWKYPHATDPTYHDFQIFGGQKEHTKLLAELFIRNVGPHIKIYQVDAKTAEVIKYTENMYIATKVTFVNEMYEICKAMGVEWVDVREGWLLDKRVSRMFTGVFTDPGRRGFQGKCLPKDTKALISSAQEHGYSAEFLKAVLESNNRIREDNDCDPV